LIALLIAAPLAWWITGIIFFSNMKIRIAFTGMGFSGGGIAALFLSWLLWEHSLSCCGKQSREIIA